MPSTYCAHCGFKNDYSAVKPKFCGSCGNSFDAAFRRGPTYTPPTAAVATVQPIAPTQHPHPQPPQIVLPPGYRLVREGAADDYAEDDPLQVPDLPPNSITASTEGAAKLTIGQLKENADAFQFERPIESQGTNINGEHIKSPSEAKRERLANMRQDLVNPPAVVPQAAIQSQAAQGRRRRSRS